MGQSAKWYFKNGEWFLVGQHGNEVVRISNSLAKWTVGHHVFDGTGTMQNINVGTLATLQSANIGGGGALTYTKKLTGTCAAITAVGTGAIAIGTITGATGLAVGDAVMGIPKTDRSAGHVGVGGFFVPSINTLNVWLQNSKPDSAGSFPATGFDVFAAR